MSNSVAARAILTLCAILTARCAYRIAGIPTQHVVMVDAHGKLMDPTGSADCSPATVAENSVDFAKNNPMLVAPPTHYSWQPCNGRFDGVSLRPLGPDASRGYLNDLFDQMDAYYAARSKTNEHQIRRVVLIIHGGLNTNQSNLESAQRLAKRVLDSGSYPIFILWQSNLWSALWEHTVNMRQGNYHGWKSGLPLAPFYLIGDLGRGITRAPVVWGSSFENEVQSGLAFVDARRHDREPTPTEVIYERLRKQREQCLTDGKTAETCAAVDIQEGPAQFGTAETVSQFVRTAPTAFVPLRAAVLATTGSAGGAWTWLPLRFLLSPLLDSLGSAAWDDMERRAILGFHSDEALFDYATPRDRIGGISAFLTELRKRVNDPKTSCQAGSAKPDCVDWNLTMIAHSMGTIVANHVVRNFNDLDFNSIVYMAAACSVREYEDNVLTYMSQPRHNRTEMYHLVLNPTSEIRDQYFFSLPPSGSLLVWIDRFFTQPHTIRDRTAGRWDNLVRFVEETPENLRGRVHVHAFGGGRSRENIEPQHHGSFSHFDFWSYDFWKTDLTDLNKPEPELCPY